MLSRSIRSTWKKTSLGRAPSNSKRNQCGEPGRKFRLLQRDIGRIVFRAEDSLTQGNLVGILPFVIRLLMQPL